MFGIEDDPETSDVDDLLGNASTQSGESTKVAIPPQKPRSWKEYLDDFLISTRNISAAAIFDFQGKCLAATPMFPSLMRFSFDFLTNHFRKKFKISPFNII